MNTQVSTKKIDFRDITGPVYTGRSRGESLRKEFNLDGIDSTDTIVDIEIPESTYTISSSFFLGLFGPSVIKAGSKDKFFSRYHFSSAPFLKEVIDSYVLRALQSRNLFI